MARDKARTTGSKDKRWWASHGQCVNIHTLTTRTGQRERESERERETSWRTHGTGSCDRSRLKGERSVGCWDVGARLRERERGWGGGGGRDRAGVVGAVVDVGASQC